MAFGIFMLGMLIVIGGVGGVENSVNDMDMLLASGVSILGLMLMWLSVPYLSEQEQS